MTPTLAPNKQLRRVLDLLDKRGYLGVSQIDCLGPNVIDGGKPITRLAARINNLKNLGYTIEVRGRVGRCARYVLTSQPDLSESAPSGQPPASRSGQQVPATHSPLGGDTTVVGEPAPLFDTQVGRAEPRPHYEADAA